ncbi:MAG: HAD hydrolase family protein [Patescibacteria group bacterium]
MQKTAVKNKQLYEVVVGLPVRNEEASLFGALESIRIATHACDEASLKLVVCINGCIDRSQEIAETFMAKYSDIDMDIIHSAEGLVRAQAEIVCLYPASIYIFPDSDNLIEEKALLYLLRELKEKKRTIVTYAKTISIKDPSNSSPFYALGMLYESQTMLSKRYYFHGRLFATRKWTFPSDEEILQRAHATHRGELLLKYCNRDILLSADDIYLSSYIMHTYGLDAISQVRDSHCYSYPIGSFRDWHNVYRRRNIEMEKMYRWFPEWNYLKPYLNRRTDWKKWLQSSFSKKALWLLYLGMKGLFWLALRIEFWCLHLTMFYPVSQWLVTSSTKKNIPRKNIFFIDIDSTLVSNSIQSSNYSKLKEVIHTYKQLGILFGLNSNRPWSEAREIYDTLELNGPVIAEDGSYYKLTPYKPKRYMNSRIKNFCEIVHDNISRYTEEHSNIDFTVLRSNDKKNLSSNSYDGLIFISSSREYTSSIYVRVRGKIDIKYTDSLATYLKNVLPKKMSCGIRLDIIHSEGKIVISPACVDRLSTMTYVCKKYYSDFDCVLISDQEDIDLLNNRSFQFATINNAEQLYKDIADYVSSMSFAEGVEDAIMYYSKK